MRPCSLMLIGACSTPTPLLSPSKPPIACQLGAAARVGPQMFGSIQDALNYVTPHGGEVVICRGTRGVWGLTAESPGPILIRGETGNPADVVLDGLGAGTILEVGGDSHTTIESLSLTGGGCVGCSEGTVGTTHWGAGSLTLRNVDLSGHLGADGALVQVGLGTLSIDNSSIHDNIPQQAGVISFSGSHTVPSRLEISRTSFLRNASADTLFMVDLWGAPGSSTAHFRDVVFEQNQAGGGYDLVDIRLITNAQTLLEDILFIGNVTGTNDGSMIHVELVDAPGRFGMRDVEFINNLNGSGSAVRLSCWGCAGTAPAVLRRVTFHGNGDLQFPSSMLDVSDEWISYLQDVDFGAGVNDNIVRWDIQSCLGRNFGTHVSGRVAPGLGDGCP